MTTAMQRSRFAGILLAVALAPAFAGAEPLEWEGTLTIGLGLSGLSLSATGMGVSEVNSASPGVALQTLRVAGGIAFPGITVLTYTSAPGMDVLIVFGSEYSPSPGGYSGVELGSATLGGPMMGTLQGGQLPVSGLIAVQDSDQGASSDSKPLRRGPQTGLGIGGEFIDPPGGGGYRYSVQYAPWTIGAATVTHQANNGSGTTLSLATAMINGFAHGPASSTGSTAQVGGVIQFVTPMRVDVEQTYASLVYGITGRLTLRFVPEPGAAVSLAAGAIALALLGRGRAKR